MSLLHLNVAEFNQILADIIHNQLQLNRLCIFGEITQLNHFHQHLYLTLSHENSHLPCVIYNATEKQLPFISKGDTCEIIGQCRYLKNKGQLTFSGVKILTKGTGKKANLRSKLRQEYKSSGKMELKTMDHIPKTIEKVGLITSENSAAFHDIQSILSKSAHTFDVIHIPSSVQGFNAENEITNALSIADSLKLDIICLSRGGGAEQDFDCFYSETLANKVCQLTTPLICGIGHKINTTLICELANIHFETPTAMTQWLCEQSMNPIFELESRLKTSKTNLLKELNNFNHLQETLKIKMKESMKFNIEKLKLKTNELNKKILINNPLAKLTNGFNYIETSDKLPLKSIQQISTNDKINLTLNDGTAKAEIKYVNKKTNYLNRK
ncbi:MAG: exodeoxyribonuclease VII large subunit [Candidatus Margulisiibacteriota bacterium]